MAASAEYTKCLTKCFKNTRSGALTLHKSQVMQQRLGHPDSFYKTIHVGGTNGKGSVCTKLARSLEYSGLKVGLFLSPHINSIRERISINSELISESQIAAIVDDIERLENEGEENTVSFFELMVFSALEHFKREQVDVAVIEVGLGGRLDATNVITPVISVITNVSMDHVRILGDTVEEIGLQKAGILKKGITTVLGPGTPLDVMEDVAEEVGANLNIVDFDWSNTDYDFENQRVARRALEVFSEQNPDLLPSTSGEAIERAMLTRPPCRMDKHTLPTPLPAPPDVAAPPGSTFSVVLDAAHNAAGVLAFMQNMLNDYPDKRFRAFFGMCQDKAVNEALSKLNSMPERVSGIHFVKASTSGRAAEPGSLEDQLMLMDGAAKNFKGRVHIQKPGPKGFANEVRRAAHLVAQSKDEEILVMFGSFFILAEARPILGINIPVDPFSNRDLENLGARSSITLDSGAPYPLV